MIHVEPVVHHIRCFQGEVLDRTKPYDCIMTLVMINPTTAVIQGACGKLNRRYIEEIESELRSMGIEKVYIERKGHMTTLY